MFYMFYMQFPKRFRPKVPISQANSSQEGWAPEKAPVSVHSKSSSWGSKQGKIIRKHWENIWENHGKIVDHQWFSHRFSHLLNCFVLWFSHDDVVIFQIDATLLEGFLAFFWRNTCGNLLELANIYPSKKTWKAWAIGFSSNFSFEASSGWHVRKWLYTPSQLLF